MNDCVSALFIHYILESKICIYLNFADELTPVVLQRDTLFIEEATKHFCAQPMRDVVTK